MQNPRADNATLASGGALILKTEEIEIDTARAPTRDNNHYYEYVVRQIPQTELPPHIAEFKAAFSRDRPCPPKIEESQDVFRQKWCNLRNKLSVMR